MSTYIMIPSKATDALFTVYPLNDPDQIARAREALRAAGLRYAEVFRGLPDEAGSDKPAGYALPAADAGYYERPGCDPQHADIKVDSKVFEAATVDGYTWEGIRFRHCRRCRSTLSHPEDFQSTGAL